MSDLKTRKTEASVDDFLTGISNDKRREDCRAVVEMMREITGEEPKMWGPSIIGFGQYHYKYESGREGDFFRAGVSPRKQNLTLYVMPGFARYDDLMGKLGKHTTGKSCLYIKKLEDVDLVVLRELIAQSYKHTAEMYD